MPKNHKSPRSLERLTTSRQPQLTQFFKAQARPLSGLNHLRRLQLIRRLKLPIYSPLLDTPLS